MGLPTKENNYYPPAELNLVNFRLYGKCRDPKIDNAIFFPKKTDSNEKYQADVRAAKAVCRECVVIDLCGEAGTIGKEDGIWGGLTKEERRQLGRITKINRR